MAFYPQSTAGLNYATYPAGPTPAGASAVSSGSTNTKGSYVQVVASSGFACVRAIIDGQTVTASFNTALFDLATGAGGSEVVVIANLLIDGQTTTSVAGSLYEFPLAVPASTRLAAAAQCNVASVAVGVAVTLIAAGGQVGIASFTTIGAATGTSRGTSVDPGGSANTKGAYTQMVASSAALAQWMTACQGGQGNAAPTANNRCVDLATGAGGSEVVLVSDLRYSNSTAGTGGPRSYGMLTYIAASTRIAARASSSIIDATDRLFDFTMVLGTASAEAALPPQTQLAVVQRAFAQSAGSQASVATSAIQTTSGNLLVALVFSFGGHIGATPVTDSAGNTWQSAIADFGSTSHAAMFYAPNCIGALSHTFTFTGSSAGLLVIAVYEVAGANLSTPLSGSSTSSATTTAHSSGTITANSSVPEIFIGGMGNSNGSVHFLPKSPGAGTDWAGLTGLIDGANEGCVSAYRIVSPNTADAFQDTSSASAAEAIMVAGFKAALAVAAPAGLLVHPGMAGGMRG